MKKVKIEADDPFDPAGKIIRNYINTAKGRSKLASALTAPIKIIRDNTSIARKALLIQPLSEKYLNNSAENKNT